MNKALQLVLRISVTIFYFHPAPSPVGRWIEEINGLTDADSGGQAEIDSLLDWRNAQASAPCSIPPV